MKTSVDQKQRAVDWSALAGSNVGTRLSKAGACRRAEGWHQHDVLIFHQAVNKMACQAQLHLGAQLFVS